MIDIADRTCSFKKRAELSRLFGHCLWGRSWVGSYVFLTFAMGVNGVEFFYFYPREAQTILRPFSLLAIVWLVAAGFSVLGLITLGSRADGAGRRVTRGQLWAVILGASIALILILVEAILFQYLVPFWWIGTVAVGICWLGLGDGVAQIIGGRRKLILAFLASLLGIGAIVEIWSLSHWLYSGFVPLAGYGKTWPDLEMNLTYAWSSLFPAIFLAT